MQQVSEAISKWKDFAKEAGVSNKLSMNMVHKAISKIK
jgi:hypothetical protein